MKILLIGASGLLGAAFAQAASRRKHEVIGIIGSYNGDVDGLRRQISIDLNDLAELERTTLELFPDAIVNCAARSIPSDCENDPEATRRINVEVPEKLALLSRHLFARYLHISSDQVFDGREAPYFVDSEPSPPNQYAKQKLESERAVLDQASEFASVIRAPLLNGNSPRGDRSLHEMLFRSWSQGQSTSLFTDEYRQPCLVDNLAAAMVELCERTDLRGLLHWGGSDRMSRFEIGKAILERFGLPSELVQSSQRGDDPRFADRQEDLSLDLQPMAGALKTRPQTFAEQLESLIVPIAYREWYHSI